MRRFGKYIRRTGYRRRKFGTTRVRRSRRIFRKFIRKAPLRPEFKFVDTVGNSETGAGTGITTRLTPVAINNGTTYQNRVGNKLKFIKVDIRTMLRNNSSTTGGLAPEVSALFVRVIVWSPRTDITSATTIMTNTAINSLLDFNTFTVYRDFMLKLYPPYMEEGGVDATPAGNGSDRYFRKMSIKFPRKVYFAGSSSQIDEEKYSMYMTLKTEGALAYNIEARTWFMDI